MFIKLTEKATDPNALLPIFVAVEHIQWMQWDNQTQDTTVDLRDSQQIVRETPEEILAIIRQTYIDQAQALYNQAVDMPGLRGKIVRNPGFDGKDEQ